MHTDALNTDPDSCLVSEPDPRKIEKEGLAPRLTLALRKWSHAPWKPSIYTDSTNRLFIWFGPATKQVWVCIVPDSSADVVVYRFCVRTAPPATCTLPRLATILMYVATTTTSENFTVMNSDCKSYLLSNRVGGLWLQVIELLQCICWN